MPPHHTFLFGIARRLYYAFLRKRQNGVSSLDEAPDIPLSPGTSGDTPANGKWTTELLSRMGSLSQNQRKVIQLVYVEGLSRSQAAEKLGISRRTLRTHETRAMELLQAFGGAKLG